MKYGKSRGAPRCLGDATAMMMIPHWTLSYSCAVLLQRLHLKCFRASSQSPAPSKRIYRRCVDKQEKRSAVGPTTTLYRFR